MTLDQLIARARAGEIVVIPVAQEIADGLRVARGPYLVQLDPHHDDHRICDLVVRAPEEPTR